MYNNNNNNNNTCIFLKKEKYSLRTENLIVDQ